MAVETAVAAAPSSAASDPPAAPAPSSSPATETKRRLELLGAIAGILGCFLAYGYLQEKIMSTAYAPDDARFRDSGTPPPSPAPTPPPALRPCTAPTRTRARARAPSVRATAFLVLCNRLVAITMAVSMILLRRERFVPVAPLSSYLVVALSNFVATYCQYEGAPSTDTIAPATVGFALTP